MNMKAFAGLAALLFATGAFAQSAQPKVAAKPPMHGCKLVGTVKGTKLCVWTGRAGAGRDVPVTGSKSVPKNVPAVGTDRMKMLPSAKSIGLPGVVVPAFDHAPAEAVGGARHLSSLAAPLPELRFCPTGGIDLSKAPSYLALPNVVCVGGSWMLPKSALAAGDYAEVEDQREDDERDAR